MAPMPKGVAKDDAVSVASSSQFSSDVGGHSSSSASNRTGAKRQNQPPPVEVDIETRNVYCAKLLMIGVLSMAAVAASMATFLFTTNDIERTFQSKFQEYSIELVTVSQARTENHLHSLTALSQGFTSFATGANSSWPFVSLPVFEAQAGSLREDINAAWLALVPLVDEETRVGWEFYASENDIWIAESRKLAGEPAEGGGIYPVIFRRDSDGQPYRDNVPPDPYYAPIWQITPPSVAQDNVNYNQFESEPVNMLYQEVVSSGRGTFSGILDTASNKTDWPRSFIATPVYDTLLDTEATEMVAMLLSEVPWHTNFENILPDGANGVVLVLTYSCEGAADVEHTFGVYGPDVIYIGPGDLHAHPRWTFDEYSAEAPIFYTGGTCSYSLHLFPSDELASSYESNRPAVYTSIVVLIFLVTSTVFVWYDCTVNKRQDKVDKTAAKTSAIVESFFPSHIRDRIMQADEGGNHATAAAISRVFDNDLLATKPIADLFPHATVMFADIVGFTAWSSVREPSQVFTLLETVYNAFDKIAARRRVFKVETIGDCYVAAAGLPDPREDHAIVMARFARDCLETMGDLVHTLETTLGPDTAELRMRFGLHSGPVTGGVLRGDKSRFQLFGDTVNTAARIESTGLKNKIHLSKETANLLVEADKADWVREREDIVVAKGKGEIKTYWLVAGLEASNVGGSDESTSPESEEGVLGSTRIGAPSVSGPLKASNRLIGWNVDVLARCLKQIVAMREPGIKSENDSQEVYYNKPGQTVLDEVQEIIALPGKPSKYKRDPEEIDLGQEVMSQLTDLVSEIANKYRENPFHNFQHASHVTQSLTKLLSRVVAPEAIDYDEMTYKKLKTATLHKFTFGLTSDPLTHFACTFSALIHDADHPGVPNAQLVREGLDIAEMYKNKSCAEQHSVDLAWGLLMQPKYRELRACIYTSQAELERFRQLVVNSVMATDIVDKELGALRKRRWEKAFAAMEGTEESDAQTDANRKATIVIEHLIQAADVAHTMQHWHVYRKWNERFFQECYSAYLNGRAEKDPSEGWYEGELGFFDFYIIPLAKKLEECGVFGVSSDECLNYAKANRKEWEQKGRAVVAAYLEAYGTKDEVAHA